MPTFALNFYSPVVADQLRTGRKTATIRLGDKSSKYRKGMIVTVLVGARYGQREKVFDAVIDKVEVKQLVRLSPREIEHDNPEIRRGRRVTEWLGRLYNRGVSDGGHGDSDPLLPDRRDDVLIVGEPMVPHGPPPSAQSTDDRRLASRPAEPASGRDRQRLDRRAPAVADPHRQRVVLWEGERAPLFDVRRAAPR